MRGVVNISRVTSANAPRGKIRNPPPMAPNYKWHELPQCQNQRFSMPIPPNGWTVFGVNTQCVHNEILALVNRAVVPVNCGPTYPLLANLSQLPQVKLHPERGASLLAMFPQPKRRVYKRWMDKDITNPGPMIRAFTKMERIPIIKRGKVKAPRLIQARNPAYHWQLAAYTKPLEHHLYQWHLNGSRVIAKGLNLAQRAQLLQSNWLKYDHPACLSLDATDWDGHVSSALLNVEHEYYLQVFGRDPHLMHLLHQQLVNKGKTLCGVKYTIQGARMSGDMNTALGNCVLAALLAIRACQVAQAVSMGATPVELGGEYVGTQTPHASIVCDGDDTLIIAEQEFLDVVKRIAPRMYAHYGHVLRVDGYTDRFWDIEFCQNKPFIRADGQLVMCPDPRKVLQTAFMATGRYTNSIEYQATLWEQRAIVHTGLPVFAKLFARLARKYPQRLQTKPFFGFEYADPHLPECEITDTERWLFHTQWDFPPDLQLAWENAEVEWCPNILGVPADWEQCQEIRDVPLESQQRPEQLPLKEDETHSRPCEDR